jgi:hypothetical protein
LKGIQPGLKPSGEKENADNYEQHPDERRTRLALNRKAHHSNDSGADQKDRPKRNQPAGYS